MKNIMHKISHHFTRLLGINPLLSRMVRYRNPKQYWTKRGGERYFQEQESAGDRSLRSEYMCSEIRKLDYASILEIGCGYCKQLRNLKKDSGTLAAGIDFSRPQLLLGKKYAADRHLFLAEADASQIPLGDKLFDAAFSSAVILHNEEEKARKIISEMIRVSRRYLIHNEDTDITFSRYGFDLLSTYKLLNFKILHAGPIPSAPDPSITQFLIAELPTPALRLTPGEIPLQYKKKS